MSWECACGFTNKAQNEVCGGNGPMGCKSPNKSRRGGSKGKGKGKAKPSAKVGGGALQHKGGAQWECVGCGFSNRATNEVCGGNGPAGCKSPPSFGGKRVKQFGMTGGSAKGGFLQKVAVKKGGAQWECACGFSNRATNEVCGGNGPAGCKSPPARPSKKVAMKGGSAKGGFSKGVAGKWECGTCGFSNKEVNQECGGAGPLGCKSPKPRGGKAAKIGKVIGKGFAAKVGKAAKSASKGVAGVKQNGKKKGGGKSKGGQWECDCGFTNKSSNEVCGGSGPMGCKSPQQ